MRITKELQEELIQVANEMYSYQYFGSDHITDHMKADLFRRDSDGYEHEAYLIYACAYLIKCKNYALKYSTSDTLKADITALENLMEEVQRG